jgi:hypothetical protein
MTTVLDKFTPCDFTLEKYWGTFGNNETETSAYWVIWFLQERDRGWEPFTYGEIDDFYNSKFEGPRRRRRRFSFNRLLPGTYNHISADNFFEGPPNWKPNPGGIKPIGGEGRSEAYQVTDEFITPLIRRGYLKG